MKSLAKDILRTIGHERKRFVSILVITALGVTMLTGLRASCNDLRHSADALFDEQRLFDIQISSTLGLEEADVEALQTLDDALLVEGEYAENLFTEVNGVHDEVTVRTMGSELNLPTVLEGTLPTAEDEVAVTESYLIDSGKEIGDTVTFSRTESDDATDPVFAEREYTITASVINPFDINDRENAVSFRAAAAATYTFFVLPSAADTDLYTSVYVYLKDTEELLCYGDVYQEIVQRVENEINETLKEDRQQERTDTIYREAMDAWEEAYDAAMEELDAAEAEIDEARQQLLDAQTALEEGQAEIDSGLRQIADGEAQLAAGKKELTAQEEEAEAQLAEAEAELDAAQAELDAEREETLAALEQAGLIDLYGEAASATFAEAQAELDAARAGFAAEEEEARDQIAAAWETIRATEAELSAARAQLLSGQAALEEGRAELEDGWAELADGEAEFSEAREEAVSELEDAKAEIEDLPSAKWYIQSRDSLSGYSNIRSDAASIQSIGNFIPLIFFLVAILISLTAITRMVEEDRGLIGTYKALGFKTREIRRKYLVYAAVASALGGVVGDFCGFVVLPKILFAFFDAMYDIPKYDVHFEPASGIIGILMFMVGILLAVLYAVHSDMTHMPATLMRPSVPKGGTRIFLEHIPVFWKRLSFLNKVTARNLFRYKKRLFMTVIGIMGCTGILVCGFGIKNTVADLQPSQYDNVVRYDILAVATDNDKMLSYMDDPENIESYLELEVNSMTIRTQTGENEVVQVLVVPDDAPITEFVKLADADGNETTLATDGIMITPSIEEVLGVEVGDTVFLQDLSFNEAEFPVALVTENYLGDVIYVSESCYEAAFGRDFTANGVLIRLTDACREGDPIAYSDALGAREGVLSTVSTQSLNEEFAQGVTLMNVVVYVIIVLAAALAFVVLFTLATTNISERERELATIKVLGFFDAEVHSYVNKETVILSSIGIALGLPVGWLVTRLLCWLLKIPGMYFAPSVHVTTYVICAAMAVGFTLLVDQITNAILNKIDPAVALKSIE